MVTFLVINFPRDSIVSSGVGISKIDLFFTDQTALRISVHPISRNGKVVFMNEELMKKLDDEQETWHWTPWLRTRLEITEDGIAREAGCSPGDSIESFPDGIFNGKLILI